MTRRHEFERGMKDIDFRIDTKHKGNNVWMTPNTEYELFLVALFIALCALGMCGVVMLIAGTYGAVVLAGTTEGIPAIVTAVEGLLICGASAVLFAALWPDSEARAGK